MDILFINSKDWGGKSGFLRVYWAIWNMNKLCVKKKCFRTENFLWLKVSLNFQSYYFFFKSTFCGMIKHRWCNLKLVTSLCMIGIKCRLNTELYVYCLYFKFSKQRVIFKIFSLISLFWAPCQKNFYITSNT